MANSFDAAARLAEGRPAVDDVEEYVQACRRLGYQHQDLTMHPAQIRDWYGSEDGLDLRALDADCAALAAAATTAEDAARTQTDLVAELGGAWSGRGAAAALEFAWRSGQAATAASSAVRAAADAMATLRDELWRAVDAKVDAVQGIDGRHQAQRGEWLTAARTVTTGAGDVAAASELVDLQVKPFVHNDIGTDWLAAMRTATASIRVAYDAAIATSSAGPPAVFDVPGELGPRAVSPAHPGSTGGTDSAPTTPAAAVASTPMMAGMPTAATTPSASIAPLSGPAWSGSTPAVSSPSVDPAASAPAASPSAAPSLPSMPSLGDLGGAAPSLGAGAAGFGQQLADLIGGLVGSADGTDEGAGPGESVDESDDDDPFDDPADEDETDETDETEEDESPDDDPASEVTEEPGEEAVEDTESDVAPTPLPEPTPVPSPPALDQPPAEPAVPESVAETAEPTPCEIAADELPQVGE